jgi:hypothetical protein
MTTNNNANPVNNLVASFRKAFDANLIKQHGFQLSGHRVLWEQIAEAFAVAQGIIKKETEADYHAALKERDIKPATGKGSNPYLPVVKLLYGEWKDEQHTVFEPNRSAEKYACVFRYLNKHFADKSQAETVAHIENYSTSYGNHLKGMEAQDRAENQKPGPKVDSKTAFDIGSKITGAIVIDRPDFVPEDAKMGQLWFKTGKDGKVYILGFRKLDDKAFKAVATKRGRDRLAANVTRSTQELLEREDAA